jgi:asparagine synthase (glutamine-hydrolysing)
MSFSVESRVPFLTTGIAELALSLPEEYLVSPQGESKAVLRAAMRGFVPEDVLHRRDKVGFVTPQQDWLLRLGDRLEEWVEPAGSCSMLDVERIRRRLREWVASGGRSQTHDSVWRLVGFCIWLDVMGRRLSS